MLANDLVNGGIFSRYADLRLAQASSRFAKKAAFHDPIFERVKRDDCQSARLRQS
jgi:aminoglycoside phosphotransferase